MYNSTGILTMNKVQFEIRLLCSFKLTFLFFHLFFFILRCQFSLCVSLCIARILSMHGENDAIVRMKSLTVLTKQMLLFQVMGIVYIYHQASLKALARLILHGFPLMIKNVISSLVAGPTMVGRYGVATCILNIYNG